eukprot:2805921-Pyramimonas_sp.AAC.1
MENRSQTTWVDDRFRICRSVGGHASRPEAMGDRRVSRAVFFTGSGQIVARRLSCAGRHAFLAQAELAPAAA